MLSAQLLATIGLLFPVLHQRRLIDRAREVPGSVTRSAARSADHTVAAFADTVTVLFVLTGLIWLVWFFRARANVDAWSQRPQRYRPGWAVWSWVVPIASLWLPYPITRDVVEDSERSARAPGSARPLLLAWWIAYALLQLLWIIDQALRRAGSIGGLRLHSDAEIALVIVRILAVWLAILVVRRLTSAQTERIGALAPGGRGGGAS